MIVICIVSNRLVLLATIIGTRVLAQQRMKTVRAKHPVKVDVIARQSLECALRRQLKDTIYPPLKELQSLFKVLEPLAPSVLQVLRRYPTTGLRESEAERKDVLFGWKAFI